MKNLLHLITLSLLVVTLSSCATTQNNYDPIAPVNRVTDSVNDGIDRLTLKPLAQGYTAAVPKSMRTAVSNFYDNTTYMNTVLNDFLQGKGGQGIQDLLRFLINSTLGFAGLVDVASSMGLERHEEDFGQTLATWGLSQGAYIVYPLLGPNSLRKTPDFLTATATDPLFWAGLVLAPYVTIPVAALKYVNKRSQLLEASDMRDELALDPYVFTREAWRQNREFQIHDGHPPAPASNEDDDWEEDDFDSPEQDSPATQPSATDSNMEKPAPGIRISLSSTPPANADTAPVDAMLRATPSNIASIHEAADKAAAPASTYIIYLSSHFSEVEAAAEQGRISKLGIATSIVPVDVNQHTWYRLQASEHANRAEAFKQLEILKARSGLSDAWINIEKHP